jgi:hypothetical protein
LLSGHELCGWVISYEGKILLHELLRSSADRRQLNIPHQILGIPSAHTHLTHTGTIEFPLAEFDYVNEFLNDRPSPPAGVCCFFFSLQRLVLRRNKIKSVDNALRFYQELVYVDFSHNRSVLDDFSPPSTFMFR